MLAGDAWMYNSAWMPTPQLVVQTSSDMHKLLTAIRMDEFAGPLAMLGITHIADLGFVTDEDLANTGMMLVHLRKIRQAVGQPAPVADITGKAKRYRVRNQPLQPCVLADATIVSESESTARGSGYGVGEQWQKDAGAARQAEAARQAAGAGPTTLAAAEADQAAKMAQCAYKAQTAASESLTHVLGIGGPPLTMEPIIYALTRVDSTDGSPELAAAAFIATSRALSMTTGRAKAKNASRTQAIAEELNVALQEAVKRTRNYLIWRTQLRSPIGDRGMFVSILMTAMGAKNLPSDLFSHLMHSHSLEVLLLL
jgi:hypothetical protein